jgi:hypothetical protein
LSAPEREVTSPSDFKVVGALHMNGSLFDEFILIKDKTYLHIYYLKQP